MKKVRKMLFSIVLLVLAIFQISTQMKKTEAATAGEIQYLQRDNKGFYSIQKWNGSEWIYVTYSITYYTDSNGVKRIAYCIDPDLKGIGWIKGEYAGYDVKLKELLSNEKLWRVYTNGYPYKTPSQMGVETEDDAYLATKMASYAILRGNSIEEIRQQYRAGTTKVENESLEDIQRRGTKVIDAICKLIDIGYNGSETIKNNNILQISKQSELSKDLNKDGLRVVAVCQKNDVRKDSVFDVSSEKDMVLIGFIGFLDPPKESAKIAIEKLKKLGINTKMFTGDKSEVANKIAKQAGINEVKAEMLPTDKYNELEKVLSNKKDEKLVAFVGDGINDSPVLARADLGISMGGIGSNSAIEASDVVIMTDELDKIPEAISISKKTNRIIKQNLTFAIGVKLAILLLSVFGIADMWEAVFADVGTTLITILNTIRILK